MKLTFLGTGTSTGVPSSAAIARPACPTTRVTNVCGFRYLIEHRDEKILVDTSIDFRQQALRAKIRHLDAVLITHCHVDHVFGLDDIRPLNFRYGAMGDLRQRGRMDGPSANFQIYIRADTFRRRAAATDSAHRRKQCLVLHRRRPRSNAARGYPRQAAGDRVSLQRFRLRDRSKRYPARFDGRPSRSRCLRFGLRPHKTALDASWSGRSSGDNRGPQAKASISDASQPRHTARTRLETPAG